jgi:hypothetical protein
MYCKAKPFDCNLNGIMGRKQICAQTLHVQPGCKVVLEKQKRPDKTDIKIADSREKSGFGSSFIDRSSLW